MLLQAVLFFLNQEGDYLQITSSHFGNYSFEPTNSQSSQFKMNLEEVVCLFWSLRHQITQGRTEVSL